MPIHASNVHARRPGRPAPRARQPAAKAEARQGRQEAARRSEDKQVQQPARLKEKYLSEVKPKLKERFGIENDMAVPAPDQDRGQHGRQRRGREQGPRRHRRHGPGHDHRPAARPCARRASRSRASSCARACRSACAVTLRGDAHVGVRRPPDQRRPAAYPRLPRREGQARRSRQLHAGPVRADRLPRDRASTGSSSPRAWTSPS